MQVQLVCPKCHYEFQYNNGYYDKKIAELGAEIQDINCQLVKHKQKSKKEQYENSNWYWKAKESLMIKCKQIAELKSFRKLADQQREKQEYQAFKNAVKEICGEKLYKQCLGAMLEATKAYNVSDMAKAEYTRAKGKPLISINKI